jgi:HEAT repeat protein
MTIDIIAVLAGILRNSFLEDEVRTQAAHSLAEIGNEEAVRLLVEVAEKGAQPAAIRIAAIAGLGKIGGTQQRSASEEP